MQHYEYLCTVDGSELPDCSLDHDEPENCMIANELNMEGKTKHDCKYWVKQPEVERILTKSQIEKVLDGLKIPSHKLDTLRYNVALDDAKTALNKEYGVV